MMVDDRDDVVRVSRWLMMIGTSRYVVLDEKGDEKDACVWEGGSRCGWTTTEGTMLRQPRASWQQTTIPKTINDSCVLPYTLVNDTRCFSPYQCLDSVFGSSTTTTRVHKSASWSIVPMRTTIECLHPVRKRSYSRRANRRSLDRPHFQIPLLTTSFQDIIL